MFNSKFVVPDLQNDFFCHSHAPQFGFWGELRHMVRADMTLLEAIRYHNRAFAFKHQDDGLVPLTHEIPHQLAAIAAIYAHSLRFLLPDIEEKTGFLKPSGYNGFSDGEDLVVAIEHGLINRIVHQTFEQPDLSEETFLNQIRRQKKHSIEKGPQMIDLESWMLANKSSTHESIHGVKRQYGYDTADLRQACQGFLETDKPLIGEKTKYGEAVPTKRNITISEYRALFRSISPAIQYMNKLFLMNDGNSSAESIEKILGSIKIRDLHVLIGGEKAANAYFKSCGIENNKAPLNLKPLSQA